MSDIIHEFDKVYSLRDPIYYKKNGDWVEGTVEDLVYSGVFPEHSIPNLRIKYYGYGKNYNSGLRLICGTVNGMLRDRKRIIPLNMEIESVKKRLDEKTKGKDKKKKTAPTPLPSLYEYKKALKAIELLTKKTTSVKDKRWLRENLPKIMAKIRSMR